MIDAQLKRDLGSVADPLASGRSCVRHSWLASSHVATRVEHDRPHPRKLKAQQKALQKTAARS
jgi:hypothetical protein